MKVSVTKQFEFEACHKLPNYDGCCVNLHGHSYKLEVEVEGVVEEVSGMIMDFSTLKSVVKALVVDKLDHTYLNDLYDMPTAENMVVDIYNRLKNNLDGVDRVVRVRLWETSTSYAECKTN